MADVKNIITLGIGASPGSLLWFMTSGLESGAEVAVPRVDVESTTALAWSVASSKDETYTVASSTNSRA